MKEFVRKCADRIHGVLSCFDRVIFRGYLPIRSQKSQLENQPHPSALPRSRIDRQDSAHPPLARHRLRTPRHGHRAVFAQL